MTVVQLGAGYTSGEAELRDIAATRAAHTSTWAYQLGLTFSDPGFMRGIVREKELAGDLVGFASAADTAASSWQFEVGLVALMLSPGGKVAYYAFALHDLVHTGNPWPVIGSLVLGGAFRVSGRASPLLFLAMTEVDQVADDLPSEARLMLGYDNCFLAGTLVESTSRGLVSIEDVVVGDRVAPPPGHEGCRDPRCGEVVRLFRNETDQVVTITAVTRARTREHRAAARDGGGEAGEEDGEPPSAGSSQTIRCTPGHPFFVEGRGWVLAGDLRVGDELEARGERVVIAVIEATAEQADTFNFEVACHHTYRISAAAGEPSVLVHNMSAARRAALNKKFGRTGNLDRDINARGGLSHPGRPGTPVSPQRGGPPHRPGGYRTHDVDMHGNLSPGSRRAPGHRNTLADNQVQSHHPVQDHLAAGAVPGYSRNEAPGVLLPSSSGMAHANLTAAQGARQRAGIGWQGGRQEMRIAYQQLINNGVPASVARRAIKRSYRYFDSLGAIQ